MLANQTRSWANCVWTVSLLLASTTGICAGPRSIPATANPATFHPGYFAFLPSHEPITDAILSNPDFVGVKVRYQWRDLETGPGQYDFSEIIDDLKTVQAANKQLWIHITYTQYSGSGEPRTPRYMWTNPMYGGDPRFYGNYERSAQAGGWYPLFWNKAVGQRYKDLLGALGARFNKEAHIEGITLEETAAQPGPDGYSCGVYEDSMKSFALAARLAFADKVVFQMINFACFDLVSFSDWLAKNGIGLGTPDVFTFKASLVDTIYPLFLKHGNTVPVGPDVQWDNYERNNISVAKLRDFAIDSTDPWYFFWLVREPYFSNEVVPAISERKLPAADGYTVVDSAAGARPSPPQLFGN